MILGLEIIKFYHICLFIKHGNICVLYLSLQYFDKVKDQYDSDDEGEGEGFVCSIFREMICVMDIKSSFPFQCFHVGFISMCMGFIFMYCSNISNS